MKNCLIIDDKHPKDEIEKLEEKGKSSSFEIKCHYFNPTEKKYSRQEKVNGHIELVIDKDLVLKGLQEEFDGKQQIDLIASDYDFEDKGGTDGLGLLQFLRENWRSKVPSIIYSTLADTIKENLQKEIQKIITDKDRLIEFLEGYYNNHPDHTIDKKTFTNEVFNFLKKYKFSMTNRLAEKMMDYKDYGFENIFPEFKNQKL